jgi:hypothetical protein
MLHLFAVTHPVMAIALAFLASFYITGVCLLVMALFVEPEWYEDENGDLYYVPHAQ